MLGGIGRLAPGAGQAGLDGGEWHAARPFRLGLAHGARTHEAQLAAQHIEQARQLAQEIRLKWGGRPEAEEVEGDEVASEDAFVLDSQRRPRAPLPDRHQADQGGQRHDQERGEPDVEDALDDALDRRQPRLSQGEQGHVIPFAEADPGRQQVVEAGGEVHPEPIRPRGGDQHEFAQGLPGQGMWRDDGVLHVQPAGRLQQGGGRSHDAQPARQLGAGWDVVVKNANHPHPAARLVDLLRERDAVLVGANHDHPLGEAAALPDRGGDPPNQKAHGDDEPGHQCPRGHRPCARERPAQDECNHGDSQQTVGAGAEDPGELPSTDQQIGRLIEALGDEDQSEHRNHQEHQPIGVVTTVDADAWSPDQRRGQPEGEQYRGQVGNGEDHHQRPPVPAAISHASPRPPAPCAAEC